jgi:hypothetical protein
MKESFGNRILNQFEEQMNQVIKEYDKNLHSQFITDVQNSIQNYYAMLNKSLETLVSKFYNDNKATM